jgi:5-dehydro-4-deoxyglucarate dehydratase
VTTAHDLLKRRISEGVLAFPATPFTRDLAFDPAAFEAHIAHLASFRPMALVPAGGAGELFSLSPEEQDAVVRLAVAAADGLPVIAGVGHGHAMAIARARSAEAAGADAILLFPPYLVSAEQEGLAAYVEAVCGAVALPVIVYSRNNGVVAPDTALRLAGRCENFIGLKDGIGDFEALIGLARRAGDRLVLINGVPTAEIIASQCFAAGIRSYSSAVLSFLPEFALGYFDAVRDGRRDDVDRRLADFYVPLTAIRNRKRGYAVALVKAGLRLVGRPAGPVRPPLLDLDERDECDLARLIEGTRLAVPPSARVAVKAATG